MMLLTARHIAAELGLSVETVLRWTRRGDLPAIRLPGGALRYRADAFEAWLAEREIGPMNDEDRAPQRGLREYAANQEPNTSGIYPT